MKIAIVIPCYNEEGAISEFLSSLHKIGEGQGFDLTPIVVNDCSTDNSLEIVRQENCIVLNLPINLGIGGAVQTGYRYALQHKFDLAIQMDGDGQHPAKELPKLIAQFLTPGVDIVIGSRFITGEGFQSTALRRVGIIWFTWLIKALTRKRISDPTSGFRALNQKAMKIVDNYYPNEFPEPEILIHFIHNKMNVIEIPVIMHERSTGVSSIHSWKSVYYMLKVSFGIIFSHLRFLRYGKP